MKKLHSFSLFSKTIASNRSPRHHDASFLFAVFPYSASASSGGVASATRKHMFMAQYLVDSCGFDQKKAAEVSELLNGIKSRQQPDSVLAFLRSYGIDDATVKSLILFFPGCLLLDVGKSLAPRFQALQDLGFSSSDVVHLVRSNPVVVRNKLEGIVQKIQFWQGLLGSNDLLVNLFKKKHWILGCSIEKRVQPNLEMLQECGITGRKFSLIVRNSPMIMIQKADSLKSLISQVEDLGVPRTSGMFHLTLWSLYRVKPKKFKMQIDLFRSFGWSEDDFMAALRRCPTFPAASLKTMQRKMEFLVNEAGYASSRIAMRPVILTLSLEQRLIPRYRILATLKSRGCSKSDYKVSACLMCPEKTFVEKYIDRYKDKYPDLVQLYASFRKP
ncbi:transcription termination factor MTERF8, chloroplastic-like [Curcuma longa]|uniref:transcription termination factor MTERF8, chloroplastic-like n=1 Tax=Curcuma longa TaxID=136217 RepID=UPI003D9DD177